MSCPKCHSSKNIVCLAGGIVLAQTQQMPLYCLICKQNFLTIKKKGLEAKAQYLSFEVIAKGQKLLNPKLSERRLIRSKRFGLKQQE